MYKIIGTDQKEYGPVSSEQITRWIGQGRVNAQTRAQADGGSWKTLGEFPEFADALGNRIPLSPTPASPTPASPAPAPATTTPAAVSAPAPKTSGLAIASLVLGILGIFSCGLSALVGLVLGIVAMRQVRKSNGTIGGQGLALAGTIVSAVFLLFAIPFGAALLLPALAKAKQKAETVQCMNNLKRMSDSVHAYAVSHDNHFPEAVAWGESLKRYLPSETDFKCPAGDQSSRCHYAFNSQLGDTDIRNVNPSTVVFFETEGGWDVSGGRELLLKEPRHGRAIVIAFADGHVESVLPQRLVTLRWDP